MLFIVSWRNVWRSKLRSLVIICAIALGLWGGIFILALTQGMVDQRMKSILETEISHLQIHDPNFSENKTINLIIPDGQNIVENIAQMPEVSIVTGRTVVMGMVSSAATGAGVQINGIFPEKEREVSKVSEKITQGKYFDGIKKNPIVIGDKLAQKLKVKLRSKIVLTMQDSEGDITAGAFRVAGIFKTTSTRFDESSLFVRSTDLNRIVGMENQIHEIAMLLHDFEDVDGVASRLQAQFPQLKIETWKDLAPELEYMGTMMAQMSLIVMIIIMIALLFGIVNTMLMAILERTRELGMLMSVGMNKSRVFLMIMLETVFLSIVGGIVGTVVTIATIAYFAKIGIDLSNFATGLESFGYEAIIYPTIDPLFYPVVAVMVILTAIVAAIYPAYKALTLNPATAIRTI